MNKNNASMPPTGGRPKSVAENGRYRWSLVHPVRVHRPTSHDPGRIDRLAPWSAAGRLLHGPWRNASLTHRPSTWPILPATSPCDFWAVRHRRRGAFGEIALPQKRPGECQAETVSWEPSCWLRHLPLELRCSLVRGLKHEPQRGLRLALTSSCERILHAIAFLLTESFRLRR